MWTEKEVCWEQLSHLPRTELQPTEGEEGGSDGLTNLLIGLSIGSLRDGPASLIVPRLFLNPPSLAVSAVTARTFVRG